jgi:hypothetical protein
MEIRTRYFPGGLRTGQSASWPRFEPNTSEVESFSSVNRDMCYGLDLREAETKFPAEERDFSPLHRVQTGSEVYPASYKMGTWGYFREVKSTRALS